jgi:hypothetical protein
MGRGLSTRSGRRKRRAAAIAAPDFEDAFRMPAFHDVSFPLLPAGDETKRAFFS